ncbi:VCBS repeat protein [Collimonas sp. PA-H2]|nr:VCBS repeat protein [Collimonas sp. PA-H2]
MPLFNRIRCYLAVILFFTLQPVFAVTSPYRSTDAPILIVFGQSNAQGFNDPLPASDPRIGKDFSNVYGLNIANNRKLNLKDVTWSKYNLNGFNLGDGGGNNTYNLAGEFATLWDNNTATLNLPPLYIVYISVSGNGIMQSDAGYDKWWPGRSATDIDSAYPLAKNILNLVVSNLKSKKLNPTIIGVHFNQWEAEDSLKSMSDQNAVVANYTNLLNGFRTSLGMPNAPVYFYRPRSTVYTRYSNVPVSYFNDLVNGFNQIVASTTNVALIDAANSNDVNTGRSLYNECGDDFGIFNTDMVHYLGSVHNWFARNQWDIVFKDTKSQPIDSTKSSCGVSFLKQANKVNFNSDGKSDLLLKNTTLGSTSYAVWLMNGLSTTSQPPSVINTNSSDWQIKLKGDFDGDGIADILWYNAKTDQYVIWFMNGQNYKRSAVLAPHAAGWTVVGSGDFDGDGKADLLWHSPSTNYYVIWFMDGTGNYTSNSGPIDSPSAGFVFEALGDFDGDGKTDIIWKNPTSNVFSMWLMNGKLKTETAMNQPTPQLSWSIKAIGDFNGDSKSDILWYNASNPSNAQYVIWNMNAGKYMSSSGMMTAPAAGWSIYGVGDYDGDGKSDILWVDGTGKNYVMWFMNGLTYKTSGPLTPEPPANWQITP